MVLQHYSREGVEYQKFVKDKNYTAFESDVGGPCYIWFLQSLLDENKITYDTWRQLHIEEIKKEGLLKKE
jgi:hypothetical protein